MTSRSRRSIFRPCIDLHGGQVKQIVGGTLSHNDPESLKINFVTSKSPGEFASLYRHHNLQGGHLIKLGLGNDEVAREALAAWPGGMQVGGGITADNAQEWLNAGASKVIVTSFLFPEGKFSLERLKSLSDAIGKDKLVVDLSCRRRGSQWRVAMNKWQDIADMTLCKDSVDLLSQYCSEFLVHSADVEGLCQGIDQDLVKVLAEWVTIPTTYAGGARSVHDLALVDRLSNGKIGLTYGSSLDIFGGTLVNFEELVRISKETSTENELLVCDV